MGLALLFGSTVGQISDLTPWYKNVVTCTVCEGAVSGVFGFFRDAKYIKAAEGALGLYCMWVEGYKKESCAIMIESYAKLYTEHAFTNVLTSSFICGSAFPFCAAPAVLKVSDFATTYLADKPASLAANNAMNSLYPGAATGD